MALAARRRSRDYTYADYLTWPEDERWELIEGVAYAMTPAPAAVHQAVARELVLQIGTFLKGKRCRLFFAPFDVRLGAPDEADLDVGTVVQPDIVVVCDPDKLDDRGCRGAPDFVIEIASPESVARDQVEKARLYATHGVLEYWVVHPTDRLVFVRLLGSAGSWRSTETKAGQGKLPVTTLPGLVLDLDLVFGEAPADLTRPRGAPRPRPRSRRPR